MRSKPKPPPMLLQIRGWGMVLAERHAHCDVLQRYDRLVARGKIRGRPWWRGRSKRWVKSPV